MTVLLTVVIILVVVLILIAASARIVKQYEDGVLFRLGKVIGDRSPGFHLIIPLVDVLHRISLRIVTLPIQSQGIITHDNVSVDVSAVAYFKVVDAVKSVVAIENVLAAIDLAREGAAAGERSDPSPVPMPVPVPVPVQILQPTAAVPANGRPDLAKR